MGTRGSNQSIHASSFLMGVVTGGAVATGIALYFSPRLADVREYVASTATEWRDSTFSTVQAAENGIADVLDQAANVADDITARAHAVRDELASAVERGAHVVATEARHVERIAKAIKPGHEEHSSRRA